MRARQKREVEGQPETQKEQTGRNQNQSEGDAKKNAPHNNNRHEA
jgi:hypothetical protein